MEKKERLVSLDVLRGFDMWLLLMFGPIAASFLSINDSASFDWLRVQIDHTAWAGFSLWDIIMPLFIFMSGATIPFSMSAYHSGALKPDRNYYLKLLKRFVLLFFLGWIVQGNLLRLNLRVFHPYANTLQSIAVGYVAASLIFVHSRNVKKQILLTSVLFIIYLLFFVFTGMNLDPQENIAMLVDKAVLGSHRDGVDWTDGTWAYSDWYQYTWILSSLNFSVSAMLGCFSGQMVRAERRKPSGRALALLLTGAALIVCALLMHPFFPIIKKIWSSSMTLFAGGISFILLSVVYYLVDVRKGAKWLLWLKYYGMNAITAYMIGEVIDFSSVSKSLLYGFGRFTGEYQPLLITTANAFILFFILKALYKKGLFIKV